MGDDRAVFVAVIVRSVLEFDGSGSEEQADADQQEDYGSACKPRSET